MSLPIDTITQAGVLTALVVDLILLGVLYTLRDRWKRGAPLRAGWISLIAEEDGFPSLARFQLLIWTLVVIFAFATVAIIRILSYVPESSSPLSMPTLSMNVLTLLGVNAASPAISAGLSRGKYRGVVTNAKATSDGVPDKKLDDYQPLYTMLQENKIFSVTRFQMLSWTIVALIVFVFTFLNLLANPQSGLSSLTVPDVSSTLVDLTGISQGIYLLGKGASQPDPMLAK
jgi:hypothetical protein